MPTVKTWFERDRAQVLVEDGEMTIALWNDAEVLQMIEDGFFADSICGLGGRLPRNQQRFAASVLEYCQSVGLLPPTATEEA